MSGFFPADPPAEELIRAAERALAFAERAFPICRSITGQGVRDTLEIIREQLPALEVVEVPTGTPVLDWHVPKEWNIREAWVRGPDGERVCDFRDHNLHVLNYCAPVHQKIELDELQQHLFSLPEQPDAIPYRTSYWKEHWAFCIEHRKRENLKPGTYEVYVDSSLREGSLTYGELFLPGRTDHEVLLAAHTCHPSLANDNLSGMGVVVQLMDLLSRRDRRLGYRLVLAPGTIGPITWLAGNEHQVDRIHAGLVAANLGDAGPFSFKRSRRGDSALDRAVEKALRDSGEPHECTDFVPFGYDERQYCSPGFDLPVGLLSRTPWGTFPEYHTSLDNLSFISEDQIRGSIQQYWRVLSILENDRVFRNLSPKGEPQLGRRGLYNHIGGGEDGRARQLALLWVLNQSDGSRSLLDIAERADLPFDQICDAARTLIDADLLVEIES